MAAHPLTGEAMSRLLLYILVSLSCLTGAYAAEVDTHTRIFSPDFKTLQVKIPENDQLPAFLILDTPGLLEISFDELADQRRYLRYEIEHCDARWRPDGLVSSMFMDGFNVNDVDDVSFSQATCVNYVHYSIRIPNDRLRLKISGNYLLKVYDEYSPDEIILQARFQVCENTVSVLGSVSPRTDIDYQDAHQQLSLIVEPKTIDISDPYRDVLVTVAQNSRTDNMRVLSAPMRIAGRKLYYEHSPLLIFPAGNEYRRFETVTINYPSMNVDEMSYVEPYYHATLREDRQRSEDRYEFDKTQHGRYRVREYNSDAPDTEADYILTHFTLDMDEMPGYDIFIEGDLTDRQFDPSSRMVFDRGLRRYVGSLLLKQGSYNYQYVAVPAGSETGLTAPVEGDYYQTINEYTVCVYYRKPGELFDRLVGFADFLSN